ncbi:F0F1 ATP synthase subunit gamma [Enterovirga sp.]|uniref:F0F1 ATP synthase subunit gamma n=1 Tax=Enterovirga sp. TaxID=2026350 RepID=UPI00262726D2|nr:F0F1 ATP synthase subunit gamma [Enterovirga sp.]MDB5591953.1 synthase subunit gamma [Enterovirga sp.]
MPSLKDLRNRIASVKATQKITKAMQMVAAAKLRRAQLAAEAARPFAERMTAVMANLSGGITIGPESPRLLAGTGQDRTHLLIVCTAERGLCGAFNSSISRLAREHAVRLMGQGKTVKILCVGKKGHDVLRRQFGQQIIDLVDLRAVKQIGYGEAEMVASKVLNLFEAGEFDVATLFFSRFRSVIQQIPTAQQIIPVELGTGTSDVTANEAVYEYEPDENEILASLLPRNVAVQVFRALLENAASEQGARMSAMDSATRNAGDMIKKQTQIYNRSRQAMITKELIEIISGAEAL